MPPRPGFAGAVTPGGEPTPTRIVCTPTERWLVLTLEPRPISPSRLEIQTSFADRSSPVVGSVAAACRTTALPEGAEAPRLAMAPPTERTGARFWPGAAA